MLPARSHSGAVWCRLHRSLHVRALEGKPATDEPVEIGGLDLGIPQRGDRVRALIIVEENQNIRLFRSGNSRRSDAEECHKKEPKGFDVVIFQGHWNQG